MVDRLSAYEAAKGNTLLVGAPNDDNLGSVYVFARDGSGDWAERQKLTASDGLPGDFFGDVVAIDGDTAVVGAFLNDDQGGSAGAAYVFGRDPVTGVFTETQKLLASDGPGAVHSATSRPSHFGQRPRSLS